MNNGKRKRVTLKDVAGAGNVSVATVSRALRGDPRISAGERARLGGLAERMGYRPDPELSRLMQHLRKAPAKRGSAVLALVNTLQPRRYLRDNPNTREMLEGIDAEADRLGFLTEEFWLSEPEADQRALSRVLYNRGIRGVLLLPFHRSIRRLEMDFSRISVLALGRSQGAQGVHSVVTNPFEALRLAMEKARERGYRRPGLALENFQDARAEGRYHGGYYVSQEQFPAGDRIPPFAGSPRKQAELAAWMERHRPDVVLSYGTWILDWMRNEGVGVPGGTGFIDLNRSHKGATATGVCQNYGEMGRTAVDLLVDLINKDERGIPGRRRQHVVDVTWMESGGTLR